MNNQTPINIQPISAYPQVAGPVEYGDKITDPKQMLRAFRRRLPIFFLMMLATFLLVAVYTVQATPVFSSGASIIIDVREKNVFDMSSVLSGLPADSTIVDTEVEIIRSRSLAEKVVDKLDLMDNPEFNPTLQEPGMMDNVKASIREFLQSFRPGANDPIVIPASGLNEDGEEAWIKDEVVSMLLAKTSAARMGTTYGISISATSNDPYLAAEIANQISNQYLVEQLDAKFDATKRNTAWLETRLEDLKNDVKLNESEVESYRAAQGLLTAGALTINEQKVSELSAQLIGQKSELAEAEARLSSVRQMADRGQSADISGEALRSGVITDLRRQQAEINRERADLQTRYGPLHPEIERINTEISNISNQIRSELRRIVASLESEVSIARQRVRSLERSLDDQQATLVENNRASVRLRELERNAEASRAIYESFLGTFKQTAEIEGLAEADARILSRATVPTSPSFPKTSLNLAIGLVLGALIGMAAVIVSEALNSQIADGEDIEDAFHVPFLGNFPKLTGSARKDPALHLIGNPMSSYAEAFRNLRASIMFADLDKTVKTVAITSSQPDEGKTTLTFGLGRMSAMSGSKTLIIDGDFRRKELSQKAVKDPAQRGFLELLFGECELSEAVFVDPETGLHILPLTMERHTPRDVFGSKVFDQLMDHLKLQYDLIVIDTGPLLLLAETRVLTSKVDQVVVVSRWLKTNRAALKQTLAILREFNAKIAGVILNQVDISKYHSQGYGHSGYKAHAKYYGKGVN